MRCRLRAGAEIVVPFRVYAEVARYHSCMTPPLALVRPEERKHALVGNDGLTAEERAEYEAVYHAGVGRKTLSAGEKNAFALWRSRNATS